MQKTRHWLTTLAALCCSITASAHYFEVDSIYYNVTSSVDLTVEVTYQGSWSDPNEYSGMKAIPSTVTNDGKTYRVTSIGNRAFSGCNNLTSIIIPESIKSIGDYAFEDCGSLSEVHIGSIEAWCNIDFGNFTSNPMLYANNLYVDGKNVTDLNIPNTVTTIKKYAFYGCSGLTSVSMANSVNCIDF